MTRKIFLPPHLAEDKPIIRVAGLCYRRVGPSVVPPNTHSAEGSFFSCFDCEDSHSSNSSSKRSGSSSDGPDFCCNCTQSGFQHEGDGGSSGFFWQSFPQNLCRPGQYSVTLHDPGLGGGAETLILCEFQGGQISIVSSNPTGDVTYGTDWFSIDFGESTSRTITLTFSVSLDASSELDCLSVRFVGGIFIGDGRMILDYEPNSCIQTDCCTKPLPTSLRATITGGPCAGTYQLEPDGAQSWRAIDGPPDISLSCLGNQGWYLSVGQDGIGGGSEDCDPIELNFVILDGSCGPATIKITES